MSFLPFVVTAFNTLGFLKSDSRTRMWVLPVIVNSAKIGFTDLEDVMLKITKEFFHHRVSFRVGQAYATALECIKTYVESKAWDIYLKERTWSWQGIFIYIKCSFLWDILFRTYSSHLETLFHSSIHMFKIECEPDSVH